MVVYNGEVYNAPELRAELERLGRRFRGHSDSEVVVEGIAEWGLYRAVQRLIGMFAIAVWHKADRTLSLVRDRLGIKPLYWLVNESVVLFGSELKPFHCARAWSRDIDLGSMASLMRHGYIPAPHSIYGEVRKLEPGHLLTVDDGGGISHRVYWSLEEARRKATLRRSELSDSEAVDEVETLLLDAVRRRMVADVPLGAFLSGGIDSSLVVALMQRASSRPVKTFTIGFGTEGYDEAPHAKAVARSLGTEHTELYVDPRHAWEVIPNLSTIYDEPFADSSQIPTFLISELTRRHVTVSLSGDGGDELFAGYNRYRFAAGLAGRLDMLPRTVRALISGGVRSLSPSRWNRLAKLVLLGYGYPRLGDKLHKLATVMTQSGDEMYRNLISQWQAPAELVIGAEEHRGVLWDDELKHVVPDFVERMQYLDTLTYLPDDILTKVDRASMAVSLEVRVPLLDHRVVELAWSMPAHFKIRRGSSKWLLRELLARHVPRSLFERPKMGFGVPLGEWLRGPLRDWAQSLFDSDSLQHDPHLNVRLVEQRWREHLSRARDWQYPIWTVLMLLAWKQRWV